MLEKIHSEKGEKAGNGSLVKALSCDTVRQLRLSSVGLLVSADAAQWCCDSTAHAVVSLVFQAFFVPDSAVEAVLSATQNTSPKWGPTQPF